MHTDPGKYREKIRYLSEVLNKADIVALQEVHGTMEDMNETFKCFPGWFVACSPCFAAAAGGVAILLHRRLLAQAVGQVHRVHLEGRALQVLLQLPAGTLNLLCLHLEPATTRDAQCTLLRRTLATSDPSVHTTVLMADLNTCMPGDSRMHLNNLHADDHDDFLGHWLAQNFPTFTIAEHDGFTRIGHRDGAPHSLSRIDYIMIDMPKVTILDSRFSAHVHGNIFKLTASDHAAVIARLHPPRTSPSNRRMIPPWMSSSASFQSMVQSLINKHNDLNIGPPTRDDLIEIFYVADARIRSSPPVAPLSPAAKLHWCLVAFRSRRQHHEQGLRRAQIAFPEIPLDDLDNTISELTLQVADSQLQVGTPSTKKPDAAGQAYMQKIALWRRHAPRARFMHIKTETDDIITEDFNMADIIRAHWKHVFQGTDNSTQHYDNLRDLTASVPRAQGLSDEPFDHDDVTASLRRHDSSPGPDGVCYSAWKAAGQTGINILHNILTDLWLGRPPPPSFRTSLMVFLPKSDAQAVLPSELRPLALCDADYKIIMGCINHRLALHLPDYVDDRQRGFMRGRLGMDNLLLLEAASMLASRSGSASPVLCFLDIAAAFPSLLHDFMKEVLNKFLGRHPLNHMISMMYDDNFCDLVIRGSVMPGFRVLCGVRQGCPLSGSLFALAFHPILVSISEALYRHAMHIGHDIFGYADDLALVLYEFWLLLPALDRALAVIASAAGLHINWKKVQLIPLWARPDMEYMRKRMSATCPRWKPAKIDMAAKYLGIQVGPGVTDISAFAAPLLKYTDRCRFIAKMGLGWARAASLHNIFALPVLSYVAQVQGDEGLREPDLDRAAAILFKNPMYRPPYRFFAHLDELGCSTGLRDVRLECQAAAARCSLSLSSLALARRQLTIGSDDDHLRVHPHRSWQARSAIARLGQWRDRLQRQLSTLPAPPHVQQQCRSHLRALRPHLDYYQLISDRLTVVLRRIGDPQARLVNIMASNLLDTIILASSILHCTALAALLRLSQNALVPGLPGAGAACPFCGAQLAARLSHLVVCGAVWVFLAEHCVGLGWDFSAPDRWTYLFGSCSSTSDSAAMLALAWDSLLAGSQAGRFAGDGFAGAVSRLVALSKRSGTVGRLASAMMLPPPAP
jgi:endonuclease/exonuclease/phosphatase family metal-dependent hydrolase